MIGMTGMNGTSGTNEHLFIFVLEVFQVANLLRRFWLRVRSFRFDFLGRECG